MLSVSSSGGTGLTATSHAEAAPSRRSPRQLNRPYRPPRAPASASEDAALQGYLQEALAVDAATSRALTLRSRRPALLQLSDCEGWVAYLLRLASGDSAAAHAILHLYPSLLDMTCDEVQLEQLQQYLNTGLNISQPQLLDMAKRRPQLLYSSLTTITAAADFLLAQLSGDTAAAQKMVLDHPLLLSTSVAALQGGLQCLTEQLGVPPADALGQLHKMVSFPIQARLESRGHWLQQQGFTPAQVLSLALRAPPLFSTSTDVLQRRFAAFTQTYGIPAGAVLRMLAAQPGVWLLDHEGQLTQLKLQFWQQELGYSLSDLPLTPTFLMNSLISVASRVATLQGLLGTQLTPQRLLVALIFPRRGTSADSFGPRFFSAHVKQHGSVGASVQALLQPLSARLSQPEHWVEWAEELEAHSLLLCGGRSSPQHRQLYAALDNIAARDWALSAHGVKWTAAEAEAKAADRTNRALTRAVAVADRAAAPKAPRGRPRGSCKKQGAGAADAVQVPAAGAKQLKIRNRSATAAADAVAAAIAAASAAAATAGTTVLGSSATAAASVTVSSSAHPSPAPVPSPAGIMPASSLPAVPSSASAPVTLTAQAAPRRRLAKGQGTADTAHQEIPLDWHPLYVAGAAGQEQAGGTAGGARRKLAGKAKALPLVASA